VKEEEYDEYAKEVYLCEIEREIMKLKVKVDEINYINN